MMMRINVESFEVCTDAHGRSFDLYSIHISHPTKSYHLKKRDEEFITLYQQLIATVPELSQYKFASNNACLWNNACDENAEQLRNNMSSEKKLDLFDDFLEHVTQLSPIPYEAMLFLQKSIRNRNANPAMIGALSRTYQNTTKATDMIDQSVSEMSSIPSTRNEHSEHFEEEIRRVTELKLFEVFQRTGLCAFLAYFVAVLCKIIDASEVSFREIMFTGIAVSIAASMVHLSWFKHTSRGQQQVIQL